MTEKNTLSILENIKKKMQKFDQQPKKIETVSGINDEFEYIPSSRSKSDVKIEVADFAAENAARDAENHHALEIDQDLAMGVEQISSASSSAAVVKNFTPSPVVDDLNLDDLSDLDSHHPQDFKVENTIQKSAEIASELPENNSFDDLSLDLSLDEEDEVATEEDSNTEDDFDDDLDFNLDLEEGEEQIENLETTTKIEEPKIFDEPELKKQEAADLVASSDLDQLFKEEEEAKNKEVQPNNLELAPDSSNGNESNLDEEQFLKDLGIDSSPAKPHAPLPPLENNELEIVTENKSSNAISNELLDDIDLDDLDDLEKKMVVEDKTASDSNNDVFSEQSNVQELEEKNSAPVTLENPQLSSSKNSELETALQNQNFAEIAMHILEPKLDAWLDQHLHGLVEKIVQEEVKRLFEKR